MNEDGGALPVYKTEVVKNNLSPTWRTVVTTMQRLCNGDAYRPVLIECFDWDSDGSHELIGSVQTSLDDVMRRAASGERLQLVNATRRQKVGASYANSGLLRVVSATVTPQPSFLDYIVGGCELNFMVRACAAVALASAVVSLTLCRGVVDARCARGAGGNRFHRLQRQSCEPQLAALPRPVGPCESVPACDPGRRRCPRVLRRRQAVPRDGLRRLRRAGRARQPLLPHD